MVRQFSVLGFEDTDDQLVEAIAAREAELANYDLNISNFEDMLLQPDLTQEYRQQIEKILADTRREMAKSEAVYTALLNRKPPQERWDSAVTRYKAKKLAQQQQ